MKERPILFSGAMVRAILGGAKTQTRRVCKAALAGPLWANAAHPASNGNPVFWWYGDGVARIGTPEFTKKQYPNGTRCPYGVAGDRLWVRETWARHVIGDADHIVYRADCGDDGDAAPWRPSIFMPRAYSRITLEITGVRAERIQNISEADAIAEGVDYIPAAPAALNHRTAFAGLWNSINAARGYGWDVNPWVWVIEFPPINSAAIRQATGGQADRSNEAL